MEYELITDALKHRAGGISKSTLVEELRESVRYLDPRMACVDPDCGQHAAFVEGEQVFQEPRHIPPEKPAISELTADDLRANGAKYKIDELKGFLRERGLPVSGTKAVLLERLIAHLSQ